MIEIEKKYQFKNFIEINENNNQKDKDLLIRKKTQGGWDFKKIN